MLAMSETLGIVLTLAFVLFVLGFVAYAIVRPFTHTHYEHQDNLWSHLP